MGCVICTPIETEADLRNFDCGNPSINTLVEETYYPYIVKQNKTYKVLFGDTRVALLSVSIVGVSLENSDAELAEYYAVTPSFGAVKLNYIAVDKKVQGKKIGSVSMEYIIREARRLYNEWPVRLLILDAIRDKVGWYQKLGFDVLSQAELTGTSPTVRMYIDLMPDKEKKSLDAYVSRLC